MILASLPYPKLKQSLSAGTLCLHVSDFVFRVQTKIPTVVNGLCSMYADYPVSLNCPFADFHVSLQQPLNLRRWLRPQVQFAVDGLMPFKPLPFDQSFPFFEWGLNWCISTRINDRLVIHAAVVEKSGCALIMPGDPGSGKSTLCAALIGRGWRLLSDELTTVSFDDTLVLPVPRPISLKNESIDVIKAFNSDAIISRISHDTLKGSVAHMRVPREQVERSCETAQPAWIIFPKFKRNSELSLESVSKGSAALALVENSFNFSLLGPQGFSTVCNIIDQSDCYSLLYSSLDAAIAQIDHLHQKHSLAGVCAHD